MLEWHRRLFVIGKEKIMAFFKRLFGLGSKPTTGADWTVGLFGLGSMSAAMPAAAEWAAVAMDNLPPPPEGFTWHPFKEAQMTVLKPEGWYVHQVMASDSFAGCVSKECVKTEGNFETGLELRVSRGIKETLRQALPNAHRDTVVAGALGGRLPNLPFDPQIQVLYLDPCAQRTTASRLIRAHYRQLAQMGPTIPWRGPLIAQMFVIEFDQSQDVYVLTFESPEKMWDESWKLGKQILTNLVFSPAPATGLMFSIDPPMPPDDLLRAKLLETGRSLGWSLAHEDHARGLFVWAIEVEVPRRGQPPSWHAGTFTWCMKRVGNQIEVYDPIDLVPLGESSGKFLEAISTAARQMQKEFKRRWLALVGPVTLQPAGPAMVELCVKAAVQVAQAQAAHPKK